MGISFSMTPETLREEMLKALTERDEPGFWWLVEQGQVNLLERRPWVPNEDAEHYEGVHPVTEESHWLFHAAHWANLGVVRVLIQQGEDPNHLGHIKQTALAALVGNMATLRKTHGEQAILEGLACMEALIKAGADPKRSWAVGDEGAYSAYNQAARGAPHDAAWQAAHNLLEGFGRSHARAQALETSLPDADARAKPRL